MVYTEGFTDVVNFRTIISHLKWRGYKEVPELETVREVAIAVDGKLAPWVIEESRRDPEQFREALEYYMFTD